MRHLLVPAISQPATMRPISPADKLVAPIHIDMITKGSTLYLDDLVLLRDGVFQDSALTKE